jgi:fluoroquinolone transport system permease protein
MLKLFKYDLNIQLRSGYWTVYGVIATIYILILVNLPVNIRDEVAIAFIFTDTSVLGLVFVGALVLLEKQQGVLQSLSVTPVKLNYYLFSKVFSLTLLSAVISSLLWIIPQWSINGYFILLSGVVLSSIVFTMFGIGFSAGAGSFNQFLARVFAGSMIFSLPVIPVFFYQKAEWLVFLPANAAIDLFIRITKGSFSSFQLLDLIVLIIWIYIMTIFAQKQFRRNNLFL